MNAPKIVIEKLSPSHRRYHLSDDPGCKLEDVIMDDRINDAARAVQDTNDRESLLTLVDLMQNQPRCSLGEALDTLEHCTHNHSHADGALGIVHVTINLARADWSIMNKKVVKLIAANLGWTGGHIELVEVS